ncbi:MAG TPA: DUF2461 domain-containing protein [Magnetospirillum sp.]|nr:DUF2461 domain-containing protein [Magnetospirillum sp.]
MSGFSGLPPDLPVFLNALAANNERAWFLDHKAEYQALVQEPLRDLVAALAPHMLEIDGGFDTNPKGAAVSRINRDVRFSRDKSPYRINQWICFKRPGEGWPQRPAYFLEIGPAGWRHGMGCYAAPPAATKAMRAAILARPARFQAALEQALAAGFTVEGDRYHRPSLPDGLEPCVADWIARKSAYVVCNRPLEPLLFSGELVTELRTRWQAIAPLYHLMDTLLA